MEHNKLKSYPAVIDIGSNSVRLLIKINEINQKKLNSTVLSEKLAINGFLLDDAIDRTAKAIADFYAEAKTQGCSPIYIFATEAVRSADNKQQFLDIVKTKYGIDIDVIDGETESLIGFLGACGDNEQKCGIFDIGGASVEIGCGKGGNIEYKKSLKLGMVRLFDTFGTDYDKVASYLKNAVKDYGQTPEIETFFGIGGTATSICAMCVSADKYDALKVHNTIITKQQLLSLANHVLPMKNDEDIMKAYPFMSKNRARVIRHGLILTLTILDYLELDRFTTSETDNMEGYIKYNQIVSRGR